MNPKILLASVLLASIAALNAAPLTLTLPAVAPAAAPPAPAKTFIDYFRPIPAHGALSADAWGAPNVLPRDPQNGLEDFANKYCYWDGQILRGPDGRYHIFASRWDEARGHNGWFDSVAVHAVSDSLLGPYVDKGLCWPDNQGGKGHNVTALVLPDGRYAIVVSETRPGTVFVSQSLDGPWKELGTIVTEGDVRRRASNYSVMVRPDGDFQIVPRSGQILISKNGILGPYKAQGPSIYPGVTGLEQRNLEDPVVWFSGGLYHIVVNSWSQRKAYHLTSADGITDWVLRGLAYDPTRDFVRYTDGTVNRWDKLERPGVVLENGHVVAVTLAVLDVPKDQEKGNDRHGSKVIVIPFDGAALDRDLATGADAAAPAFHAWAPTPPMGWNSWDCFGTTVTESQAKAQAEFMAAKLKAHGWQYIVVDIQWYEPDARSHAYRKDAVLALDAFGRLQPAPNRFPSAAGGAGFKPLADYVHSLGLKFGLHLMRGIPRQAVENNLPIAGTARHARDIANRDDTCPWNPDMFGVDTTKPGAQEYYDSVFALLASWGVDYVKVDDISRPYLKHQKEIEAIRRAIDRSGRPIVLSLSPGETALEAASHASRHANLWRISDDFWDRWLALHDQFARLRNWNAHRLPGAWPDADMLPLGTLVLGERSTRFTPDEQRTMMSLWSIARSPLMHGGDMTKTDDATLALLTNDEVLAVNQHSANNRPLFDHDDLIAWTADVPGSPDKYLAVFNARDRVRLTAENARFSSPPVTAPSATAAIVDADVSGGTRLFLVVMPLDASGEWNRVLWRGPRLVFADGTERPLTDLKWTHADACWDSTAVKKDAAGQPLGIAAEIPAVVEYALPAGAVRFTATGLVEGNGRGAEPGPVRFLVVIATPQNESPTPGLPVPVAPADLGFTGPVRIRDLWTQADLGEHRGTFSPVIAWHGAGLYRISPVSTP